MWKTSRGLWALIVIVLVAVTACGPSATPEPPATPMPTPTAKVVETPPPDDPGAGEVLEPVAGTCELVPLPVLAANEVTDEDWIKGAGAAAAEITILEYSDFECPGCAAMALVLQEFLKEHPNTRLVYRHFTLSFHEKAELTAEAAEAAGAQGKFWEMHDLLFALVTVEGEWRAVSLEEARGKMSEYAEQLGLDVEQFDRELDEDVYLPKIQAQFEESRDLGLPGTPTFIFNGMLFPTDQLGLSYQGMEAFLSILDLGEKQYADLPPTVLEESAQYAATLTTSQGDIVVELLTDSAPVNVNNFVFLAQEGWYDGSEFFFVQDNFAALTGDPSSTGIGYPGYYCTGEQMGAFDGAGLVGVLPNGQFFVTLGADAMQLSGQFPLIGRVVEGEEVLAALTRLSPNAEVAAAPDILEHVAIVEQ